MTYTVKWLILFISLTRTFETRMSYDTNETNKRYLFHIKWNDPIIPTVSSYCFSWKKKLSRKKVKNISIYRYIFVKEIKQTFLCFLSLMQKNDQYVSVLFGWIFRNIYMVCFWTTQCVYGWNTNNNNIISKGSNNYLSFTIVILPRQILPSSFILYEWKHFKCFKKKWYVAGNLLRFLQIISIEYAYVL